MDESFSEISDGSLLRRYKSGDQAAATRLYLKYAHRLHGLAVAQTGQDLKTRIEPEDIVQSVFRTFLHAQNKSLKERAAKWLARNSQLKSSTGIAVLATIVIAILSVLWWRIDQQLRTASAEKSAQQLEEQFPHLFGEAFAAVTGQAS